MKIEINKDNCIGCSACVSIADEYFEMDDSGLATVIKSEVADENKDSVLEAVEACPTSAIMSK